MPLRKLTTDDRQTIIIASLQGASPTDLAREYGISRAMIYKLVDDAKKRADSELAFWSQVKNLMPLHEAEKFQRQARKNISSRIRKQVYERDAYRCQYCGGYHNLSIDHIIPLAKGGTDNPDNLQTLCTPCNLRKSQKNLKKVAQIY